MTPASRAFYVASKASSPELPALWRSLRTCGYLITSTWIDESEPGQSDFTTLWPRILKEIHSSQALLLYVRPGDTLKGALIEVGAALAHSLPIVACLPRVTDTSPFGSWLAHPLVTREDDLDKALRLVSTGELAHDSSSPVLNKVRACRDAFKFFQDSPTFKDIHKRASFGDIQRVFEEGYYNTRPAERFIPVSPAGQDWRDAFEFFATTPSYRDLLSRSGPKDISYAFEQGYKSSSRRQLATRRFPPPRSHPELDTLVAPAVQRVKNMTPDELEEMMQRRTHDTRQDKD